jgi:hypothetical protein
MSVAPVGSSTYTVNPAPPETIPGAVVGDIISGVQTVENAAVQVGKSVVDNTVAGAQAVGSSVGGAVSSGASAITGDLVKILIPVAIIAIVAIGVMIYFEKKAA